MVKAGADGRIVRLRDVARIELGALDYSTNSFLLRKTAVAHAGDPAPGLQCARDRQAHLRHDGEARRPASRKGLDYNIGYNPTEFIAQSISELIKTHLRGDGRWWSSWCWCSCRAGVRRSSRSSRSRCRWSAPSR